MIKQKIYAVKYKDSFIEFHLDKEHAHNRALLLSNHSIDKEFLYVEAFRLEPVVKDVN